MIGASLAATILIGQYLGARRLHDAKRVVGTSATFAATLSVLMAILGWFICEPLLRLMQTPPQALPLAVDYMRVIFLALPFMVLYVFATSALRGAGDAPHAAVLPVPVRGTGYRTEPGLHFRHRSDSADGHRRFRPSRRCWRRRSAWSC